MKRTGARRVTSAENGGFAISMPIKRPGEQPRQFRDAAGRADLVADRPDDVIRRQHEKKNSHDHASAVISRGLTSTTRLSNLNSKLPEATPELVDRSFPSRARQQAVPREVLYQRGMIVPLAAMMMGASSASMNLRSEEKGV